MHCGMCVCVCGGGGGGGGGSNRGSFGCPVKMGQVGVAGGRGKVLQSELSNY